MDGMNYRIKLLSLLLSPFLLAADAPREKRMAMVGDSISVGAVTHKALQWDIEVLDRLMGDGPLQIDPADYSASFRKIIGTDKGIPSPTRIWDSYAEWEPYFQQKQKALAPNDFFGQVKLNTEIAAKKAELTTTSKLLGDFIDKPQMSWGYLYGRSEGVAPKDIWIPAENGNRASDTQFQVRRILRQDKGALPDDTFVFFTGNDFCNLHYSPDYNFVTIRRRFAENLMNGVRDLLEHGKTEPGVEYRVNLMKMLPVTDLIKKEALREKKVFAFGKMRSCNEMRHIDPKDIPLPSAENRVKGALALAKQTNLPPGKTYCPPLLGTPHDDSTRIEWLDKNLKAFQLAVEDVAREAQLLQKSKFPEKSIRFQVINAPAEYDVTDEDIANDCFHLSLRGQEKLARLVKEEIDRGPKKEVPPLPRDGGDKPIQPNH